MSTPSYPNTQLEKIIGPPGTVFEDHGELLSRMDQVALHVGEVGLGHLSAGWTGYRIVTSEVLRAIDEDRFEDGPRMAGLMPWFAKLAFDPYRPHIEGRPDQVTRHWRRPFYEPRVQRLRGGPALVNFWDGHIQDLPRTQIITDTDPVKHRDDYHRVNDVLVEAAPRVAAELSIEDNAASRLGIVAAMANVVFMRNAQWPKFVEYKSAGWTRDKAMEADLPGVPAGHLGRRVMMFGGSIVLNALDRPNRRPAAG